MGKKIETTRLVWIVPEKRGGIHSYSRLLWPHVKESCQNGGFEIFEPLYVEKKDLQSTLKKIKEIKPDLIHIQHEFLLFGRKAPGLYHFPHWIQEIRLAVPNVKIISTAHTVLDRDYKFPVGWRGIQVPIRWLANKLLIPLVRNLWLEKTWRNMDGVIVHSNLQVKSVQESQCLHVEAIPHFVPRKDADKTEVRGMDEAPKGLPVVLIFGFISMEKGQDIAIKALSLVKTPCVLAIAGEVKRPEDLAYWRHCQKLMDSLGLNEKVFISGFVQEDQISSAYEQATLVLAPFRESKGSGTLVQAISRGKPVLTSNLPVNLELNEREPNCLAFFSSGDPIDCARQIDELLKNHEKREGLSRAALRYAADFSGGEVAKRHLSFYQEIISLPGPITPQ